MNARMGSLIFAGAFLWAMAFPAGAEEGRSGKMAGATLQTQSGDPQPTGTSKPSATSPAVDPSSKKAGQLKKKGNAYGPGDGTGNVGAPAQDGIGHGSPHKKRAVLH